MKLRISPGTLNPKGEYTQKLLKVIPEKKVEIFLSIYHFIKDFNHKRDNLYDYPINKLQSIWQCLDSLQKTDWIGKNHVGRIKEEIMTALFISGKICTC